MYWQYFCGYEYAESSVSISESVISRFRQALVDQSYNIILKELARVGIKTGTYQIAIKLMPQDQVDANKSHITAIKSSPNLINTYGEQSASKIIQVVVPATKFEFSLTGMIKHTYEQHSIDNINTHFENQREVTNWSDFSKKLREDK